MNHTLKGPLAPITIFTAKAIHTMDDSLPHATAVAVADGRIVAVGDLASMAPWREGREVTLDERFADKVLLPGLIDNHIHAFLGGINVPMEQIAPEPWRQADGSICPAARTREDYQRLLVERHEASPDQNDWLITWGYQPMVHGRWTRSDLDQLFPSRPVLLVHRSFHESVINTAGCERLKLDAEETSAHPQVNWADGHFWETGHNRLMYKLAPFFLRPEWYDKGLKMTTQLMHQGGITTAGDMMFGALGADYEIDALERVLNRDGAPMRFVNVFDARGFSNRAQGVETGPPEQPIDFAAGLKSMEAVFKRAGPKIWFPKSAKLFADGAMFSQLMQMNAPGYTDGHVGEWIMAPEVLADGVRTFWNAGWQVHVHVNGDGGMDATLAALEAVQRDKPRVDHRFYMHHVGYCSSQQAERMGTLGAHASVNPYFIYALADDFSRFGLGPERGSQIVRCGAMLRSGVKVSFHSDFMMAPAEPLFLAWCAATRTTREGKVVAPHERLTLQQALRGVTIDAAWALQVENEVGSIVAGKRADFCVLEDDPFELGVDGLKDVRISGTVFEGTPHMLPQPSSCSLFSLPPAEKRQALPRSRYQPVKDTCESDRCDSIREWASRFGQAVRDMRLA
jgi:predicted amidohydrolase YtcJ